MKISYPVFRRGIAMRLYCSSSQGDSRDTFILDPFQGRDLGAHILRQKKRYQSKIKNLCDSYELCREVKFGTDVAAKFIPGLVIDFPKFNTFLGQFSVEARACVTLCRDKSASKVWVRFVARKFNGKKAENLDIGCVEKFYEECDEFSKAICIAISDEYAKDCRKILGNDSLKKEITYNMIFRSADSIRQDFSDTVSEFREGQRIPDLASQEDSAAADLMQLEQLSLAAEAQLKPSTSAGRTLREEFVRETKDGQVGIFTGYFGDEEMVLTGLAQFVEEGSEHRAASLGLTAELTNYLGRHL